MAKKTVSEVAKELGIERKDLVAHLEKQGKTKITTKTMLGEDEIERAKEQLGLGPKPQVRIGEERVVADRAGCVRGGHDHPPALRAHEPRNHELRSDDPRSPQERDGVGSDELPNFGMLAQDLLRAGLMRLRRGGVGEVLVAHRNKQYNRYRPAPEGMRASCRRVR